MYAHIWPPLHPNVEYHPQAHLRSSLCTVCKPVLLAGLAGGRKLGPLRWPALKGSHNYNSGWYIWLLLFNLVLRFAWAHR